MTRQYTLPPLILHPFSDASGPGRLVESSRASLMLQGLLPSGELSVEELERRLQAADADGDKRYATLASENTRLKKALAEAERKLEAVAEMERTLIEQNGTTQPNDRSPPR